MRTITHVRTTSLTTPATPRYCPNRGIGIVEPKQQTTHTGTYILSLFCSLICALSNALALVRRGLSLIITLPLLLLALRHRCLVRHCTRIAKSYACVQTGKVLWLWLVNESTLCVRVYENDEMRWHQQFVTQFLCESIITLEIWLQVTLSLTLIRSRTHICTPTCIYVSPDYLSTPHGRSDNGSHTWLI